MSGDQCLILLILIHGHKTLSIASALLKDLFTHKSQLRVLTSLFICLCRFCADHQFSSFFSLSLRSLRFVSPTVSELEFLLSNMEVSYFLMYHVCRITVPNSYIALDRFTDWIYLLQFGLDQSGKQI